MISFRRPPMWELVRTYKLIVDIVIYQKIRASRGGSDVQRFWATWDVNVAAHVTRHLNFLQRIIALRILQVRHSSTFSLLFFFLSFFSFISPPLPSPLIFSRMKKKKGGEKGKKERKWEREREREKSNKLFACEFSANYGITRVGWSSYEWRFQYYSHYVSVVLKVPLLRYNRMMISWTLIQCDKWWVKMRCANLLDEALHSSIWCFDVLFIGSKNSQP